MSEQCSAVIDYFSRCSRKAVNFEARMAGDAVKGWCKQHTPSVMATKRAERDARWKAKWDAQTAARDAADKRHQITEAYHDRLVEALGELMQVAFDGPKHPVSSTMTQSWKRDIEKRARDLLAEIEEASR